MATILFGCGEFNPGVRRIPPGGRSNPNPKVLIPVDPRVPGPPRVPRVPVDEWVCTCTNTSARGGRSTCIPSTRACVPKSSVAPGTTTTRSFLSKAACEQVGYGEAPCQLTAFRCDEQELPCPNYEYYRETYFLRDCIFCGYQRDEPQPNDPCPYLYGCPESCSSTVCPPDRPRPITPGPPLDGGGGTVIERGRPVTPGNGSDPVTYWGCIEVSSFCDNDPTRVRAVFSECRSITTRFRPPPQYRYRTQEECNNYCGYDRREYPCIVDGPTTGLEGSVRRTPITGVEDSFRSNPIARKEEIDRTTSIRGDTVRPNLESITASIISTTNLFESRNFVEGGVVSVDDFYNSNFIDSTTSSQGGVYHKVFNIFNYEDFPSNEFEVNSLNRNIFADYIPSQVSYFLKYKNSSIEWNEKYATGLTKDRIIKALNGELLNAFKSLVDIDGQKLPIDYFVGMIKRHLVQGTIDQFNPSYFIFLAQQQKNYPRLSLVTSDNEEVNRRAALGILSKFAHQADPTYYSELHKKLEINRNKFLLTDIEASVLVETTAEEIFTVGLDDAGLAVSSVSALSDYVPEGEGGGYYLTLETSAGEVVPIELDTALNKTAFVPASTRKLALSLMGQDSLVTLSVTSTFDNSELGSAFNTSYVASAQYYKLDLSSIQSGERVDNIIENVRATYVKLTDPVEIAEHSKRYGAKATQINLQYDDPFIQYADVASSFLLSQNDITFRQFEPTRSSGNYSIVTRNIPHILIINPVSETKDNPLFSYSKIEAFTDSTVTRSVRMSPHFGLSEEESNNYLLTKRLLAYSENAYKYGLVEDADTQNYYYVYEASSFPNTYTTSGRSPIGNMFYNILESRINALYDFDYVTWWDVFRRMKLTEFTSFIYSAPNHFLAKLETGYKGYKIKSVLDRQVATSSDLSLKEGQDADSVILTDKVRNAPSPE